MSDRPLPEDRRYSREHEWVREEGGALVVGITDHAQSELTDIVYVNLPAVGASASSGASVLVLESVKTVADIYAPSDGSVSAVTEELRKHPELINQDPYGRGWIFRWAPTGPPREFLAAAEYAGLIAAGAP